MNAFFQGSRPLLTACALALALSGCGYNDYQRLDEAH